MPFRDIQTLFPTTAGANSTPRTFFQFLLNSPLPCNEKCSLFLDYLETKNLPAEPPLDHLLYVLSGNAFTDPQRLNEIDAAFPLPAPPGP